MIHASFRVHLVVPSYRSLSGNEKPASVDALHPGDRPG
jgi:hypothetical protein